MEARFEAIEEGDERGGARRALRLGVTGRFAAGASGAATVRNASAEGLLIETGEHLREGEQFAVDLPQAGLRTAVVVWAQTPMFGCRFAAPLSPAELAALQLAGEPETEQAASDGAEEFGRRLHRLRTERGLSLADVADRLGVSKPTVWAWEHGKSRPVERRLSALADALGITPAGLEPGPAATPQVIENARRAVAQAYGVEPARVRIMIDL